jgi:hypothetical protein
MNREDCKLEWNATKMESSSGEPDEVYKGWEIWLECPNGGVLAAIIRKEEQIFDTPTFLDYDPGDITASDSILTEARCFIDELEPEPTYPLLELLEN